MSVVGTVRVACPGCGVRHVVTVVQHINTLTDPETKQRLLAGDLNVLACECGRGGQLAVNVLFHDPEADYYAHVCPGDDRERAAAATALRTSGATGRQRLVPSLNALVEKIKILDAGLEDWAIELTKVFMLATIGDLDRVLLFDRVDRDAGTLHWLLFDEGGRDPHGLVSPLAAYSRIVATARPPARDELQIDRAWAVIAAQALVASGN